MVYSEQYQYFIQLHWFAIVPLYNAVISLSTINALSTPLMARSISTLFLDLCHTSKANILILLFSFLMIKPLAPIDGHWGRWSQWGACDAKCGFGKHYRTRLCDDPQPKYGGKGCNGNLKESKACKLKSCGMG